MRKLRTAVLGAAIASATALGSAPAASAAPAASLHTAAQFREAVPAGVPEIQSGEVHSLTTGGNAGVITYDGGYVWCYQGNCNASGSGYQEGCVYSFTTGGTAAVESFDGGYIWNYLIIDSIGC
jgi:hypothetical protein